MYMDTNASIWVSNNHLCLHRQFRTYAQGEEEKVEEEEEDEEKRRRRRKSRGEEEEEV